MHTERAMEFHYEQHGSGIKQLQASSIVSLTCLCRSWMYTLLVWRIVFFSQTLSLPLFMHKSISFVHTKVLCTQCTLLSSACVDTHGRPAKNGVFALLKWCVSWPSKVAIASLLSTVFTHTHTHTHAHTRAELQLKSYHLPCKLFKKWKDLLSQYTNTAYDDICQGAPIIIRRYKYPHAYMSFICATHDICVVYARDMRTFSIFITIVWEVRRK